MNAFAYPSMFYWFLVPTLLAVLYVLQRKRNRAACARLGVPSTINRLLPQTLSYRRRWRHVLHIATCILWTIALAGPLLGSRLVEFKQRGLDVFIAVDCSKSMLAEDLKPNRMAHAKLLLSQLLDKLVGDRIGVIVFAGQAYVQCPLTVDTQAAAQSVESIDPGLVPIPGTVVGDAIRSALKGLDAGEGESRVLILLTDGEDHQSKPLEAAAEAEKKGLKIFTVGLGSSQGEPIPVLDENGNKNGYKRDKKGDVVLSRLDETTLSEIANKTGGRYFRASLTGGEVDEIARALDDMKHGDQKTRLFNRFENRYQWPLALGWIFLFASRILPEGKKRAA